MYSSKDLAPERQSRLREIVRQSGVAAANDLCRRLKVSAATVRRDLSALEARGMIRRVHGGAVSFESRLDEPLFDDKTSIAATEKRKIAEAAVPLVRTGNTVYLDGGSTVLELARLIRDRTDITVVTNSLRAAIELSGMGPRLILTGGELRRRSQTMVGTLARAVLTQLHVDRAFMGTIGVSVEHGITTTDPDEAFVKQLVLSQADEVVLLADSSKVGKVSFAHSGDLDDVDVFITDKSADAKFLAILRKKKIRVIVM